MKESKKSAPPEGPASRSARPTRPSKPRMRGRVPVADRDSRARNAAPKPARSLPKIRLSLLEIGVLVVVAIIVLAAVAVPLRTYFQGRTEIARITQSIEDKEQHKAELLAEIDRYQSDAYVREQARKRLGVIEPGETAYRIVDPRNPDNAGAADGDDASSGDDPWYDVLWDSIAEPPAEVTGENEDPHHHLPLQQAP